MPISNEKNKSKTKVSSERRFFRILPCIRHSRLQYLKEIREGRKTEDISHNEDLMKQFPQVKNIPILYFLLNRDFKPIGLRLLMFIASGLWFAVFPVYLFVIYMYEKNFFSYEFFTAGVIGLKSFFFVMFLLIVVLSIYLYGFLLAARVIFVDYLKRGKISLAQRATFFGAFFLGAIMHLNLLSFALASNKLSVLKTLFIASIILALYACTFIRKRNIEGVINWQPSALFLFVSVSLPMFNTSEVAEAVEIGLREFSVGPGKIVSVYDESKKELVEKGTLLLWSPEFVYFKDDENKLHAYPTKNGTHVVVEPMK